MEIGATGLGRAARTRLKISGFFGFDRGPFLVSFLNIARNVLDPHTLDLVVQVQIELAAHDLPNIGIADKFLTDRNTKRAITAVLGQVLVGTRFEFLFVLFTGKQISNPIVNRDMIAIATLGLFTREKGNQVLTANRDRAFGWPGGNCKR